jgi:hypothetical protein
MRASYSRRCGLGGMACCGSGRRSERLASRPVALRRWGQRGRRRPGAPRRRRTRAAAAPVFLCDYFTNREYRRELRTLLNRGESVHQLQRAIHYGKVAPERGRRHDEMMAISGSHALLTNVVIAWNTGRMNDVVERWRKQGMTIEDAWLRRLGPVHFGHINFRGIFSFELERLRMPC